MDVGLLWENQEWIFKREGMCYKGRKSHSSISSCAFNNHMHVFRVFGVFWFGFF